MLEVSGELLERVLRAEDTWRAAKRVRKEGVSEKKRRGCEMDIDFSHSKSESRSQRCKRGEYIGYLEERLLWSHRMSLLHRLQDEVHNRPQHHMKTLEGYTIPTEQSRTPDTSH